MLTRSLLEKIQVIIYFTAICCGLMVGKLLGNDLTFLGVMLWPLLGILLYSTFTQIPLVHVREALTQFRFLAAAIIGNFILLPAIVWSMLVLLPDEPAIQLGFLMVLLVPCTDWFITFTHLGGGDTRLAIAFTPVSLLLQVILLPAYLWLFLGKDFTISLVSAETLSAFAALVLLPLSAAYLTERWVERKKDRAVLLERMAWLPVPMLAAVFFLIAATQTGLIMSLTHLLGPLLVVFVAYLIIAGGIARFLARQFALVTAQGRTLAFSFGTRNSFVILPLALALPPPLDSAAVVIIFQSLVELIGMAIYLWWVPRQLFPAQS